LIEQQMELGAAEKEVLGYDRILDLCRIFKLGTGHAGGNLSG
jgi:hypothetical protein